MSSDHMRSLIKLVESEGLEGPLDVRGIAKLLPDVTDVPRFTSAMTKVRRGDAASLTIQERGQLAMAFVSLLSGDRTETLKLMRKIMMVHKKEPEPSGMAEAALEGPLDVRGLAKLLPDVSNEGRFVTAMAKVKRGDVQSLTLPERGQLAMAFVSLLSGDRDETMKLMRKIMMVHKKAEPISENLRGNLDVRGLARLLPDVTDLNRFTAAVNKVRRGQQNALTMQERAQLAAAFVSLLRDGRNETMQAMRRLLAVSAEAPSA